MSLDATNWAWRVELNEEKGGCRKPLKRLVLLSLADRAGEDHCCYPSMKRLEKDTEIERKTVLKVIAELIKDGLILDTGERKGITKQVKVYKLIGINGRETIPTTGQLKGQNPPETIPTMEQFQKRNSSVNGTPNSPNNGMPNSAVIGTQNLPIESPIESINKKDWLCLKKLRLELDQADPTVVPKNIIEASWFEREKKAFELFNADKNLCDDLLIYHFADTLLKNRHKYDKAQNGKFNGNTEFLVFSSPQQIYVFANKLAHLPEVISKFSSPGESYEKLASRIAAKLSDPNELQNWKSWLDEVGFKAKSKGA